MFVLCNEIVQRDSVVCGSVVDTVFFSLWPTVAKGCCCAGSGILVPVPVT